MSAARTVAVTTPSRFAIPALVALAAALAPIAALTALRYLPRPSTEQRVIAAIVGGQRLEFGERLVLRGAQQAGGRLDRLDLVVGWPDFGPPRLVARDPKGRPGLPPPDAHVMISLHPAAGSADPAERALDIYGRFVEAEIWSNPGGLLARRFRSGSPFEGEELVMTPDAREFAARCPTAAPDRDGPPARCLATFRLAGLDATVSFDANLLPDWARLKTGVLGLLGRALR
jgi:hypothetical protein